MALRRALVHSGFALQSSRLRAKGYWKAVRTVSRWSRAEVFAFCQGLSADVRGDWVKTTPLRYGSTPLARFMRRIESRLNLNAFSSRLASLSFAWIFFRSAPLAATR